MKWEFFEFDHFEVFDGALKVHDVHRKILKKISSDRSLAIENIKEIDLEIAKDLQPRMQAYIWLSNDPATVVLFRWNSNFSHVTVVIVDVEHPIKIYDYTYDEKIILIQKTGYTEFIWKITTWDDMDYNDHSSSVSQRRFIFDEEKWTIIFN